MDFFHALDRCKLRRSLTERGCIDRRIFEQLVNRIGLER